MLLTNFRFVKNCNTRRHRQGVCWGGECRWWASLTRDGWPAFPGHWVGGNACPAKDIPCDKAQCPMPDAPCASLKHCREDILGVGFCVEIVAFIDLSDPADFVYDVGDALGFIAFYNVVSFGDGTIHIC
jgi:hypothetical protein